MMGGLMVCCCDEISSRINAVDCKQSVALGNGTIYLYIGKSADNLSALGYLNMIVRDQHGQSSGWPIKSIKNAVLVVKHQEVMAEPNASRVIGMWLDGSDTCAQHWDGFTSRFDSKTLKLISQVFTK